MLYACYKYWDKVKAMFHDKKAVIMLILFAFLGMGSSQLSYFVAVKYSNAPTATVIQFLAPVFIIIYSSIRSKMLPRRIDLISIFVAVGGTFILATGGRFDQLALSPMACLWGLIAAISEAINTVMPGSLFKKYGTIPVVGTAMLMAGIAFLPNYFTQPMPKLTPVDISVIVYIIIGGTLLAYTMYLSSVQYIDPSTVGMLGAFEPLIATILSVTLLHADFGPMDMFGGFLIIVATFMQLVPTKDMVKNE
ncbi:Permease of the drug/metabolite transporter (DMT) superfamily [Lactobacillus acidophilus La-14]|nr:Permease of the drug/metabolite transporter (DMT) superfamily [Lactobacillus acidophilus La-14]